MKSKVKNNLLNALMIFAVIAGFFACIMIVGNIKGWFGSDRVAKVNDSSSSVVTDIILNNKKGSVNIIRNGVSYFPSDSDTLRDGDIIETYHGAQIDICYGLSTVSLNQDSCSEIDIGDNGQLSFIITKGDIFCNIVTDTLLNLNDRTIMTSDSVLCAYSNTGTANIYLLAGNCELESEKYSSASSITILSDKISCSELDLRCLNAFDLNKAYECCSQRNLFFSEDEIKNTINDRESTLQDDTDNVIKPDEVKNSDTTQSGSDINKSTGDKSADSKITDNNITDNQNNKSDNDAQIKKTDKTDTSVPGSEPSSQPVEIKDNTIKPEADNNDKDNCKPSDTNKDDNITNEKNTLCTVIIKCDTILNNKSELRQGKDIYVPDDGIILKTQTEVQENETAFDILKRLCKSLSIQLEYSYTPLYGSYYIEGINNLYQGDCGTQSGWMYKINGWFPNYGCSSCIVSAGDVIVWCYTCKGFGADVGGAIG